MVVIYDSLTGQSKKFASKLNQSYVDINAYEVNPKDEILLITRTFNFGEIPISTKNFLDHFKQQVKGVCVSGNRNWGKNYGAAGDKIAAIYKIPLILKFEASGFDRDVEIVKNWIEKYKNKGDMNHVDV